MEPYKINAVRAFALLTRLSSTQNIKMRELATELVLTRVVRRPAWRQRLVVRTWPR